MNLFQLTCRYSGTKVDRNALQDSDEDAMDSSDSDEYSQSDQSERSGQPLFREQLEFYDDNIRAPTASSESELDSGSASGSESDCQSYSSDAADVDQKTNDMTDDYVNQFSNIDVCDQISKGKALKNQLSIWDNLLECRIKVQKLLIDSNKMPQFDCWPLPDSCDQTLLNRSLEESSKTVKDLLHSLLNIDSALDLQNNIFEIEDNINDNLKTDSKNSLKRKSDESCDYPQILSKRHSKICESRPKILDKWYEKTRLTGGNFRHKSMVGLEQGCTQQINRILSDMDRLVRRTQTKRSLYDVVGKPDINQTVDTPTDEPDDDHSSPIECEADPEIFDDDDFYHQMLRELIESKTTTDSTDPKALSGKWIEIQRLRNKMKRRVDTKASKGRKIRYQVHSKLVNLMAPKLTTSDTFSDEAKSQLFGSLFGSTPLSVEIK